MTAAARERRRPALHGAGVFAPRQRRAGCAGGAGVVAGRAGRAAPGPRGTGAAPTGRSMRAGRRSPLRARLLATPYIAALATALALGAGSAGADVLECGERPADASRIAVAGGSLVEILYQLDESARIVAVDRTATWPAAARELPQIGYVRDLSAEGLLSLQPTFILAEHDAGPPAVIEQLQRLGLDMLRVPEEFSAAGIRAKVRCVAAAVGADAAGRELLQQIAAAGDAAVDAADSAPEAAERGVSGAGASRAAAADAAPAVGEDSRRGIVLLGLRGGAPVAAGRDTSGDGLLAMAGAHNLMRFEGWKPVSVEAMAAARPDFIVIPERGLEMAGGMDALLEHPALRLTPAARERRVISMDGMAMLGFGPRTLEAAAQLRAALDGAGPADDAAAVSAGPLAGSGS